MIGILICPAVGPLSIYSFGPEPLSRSRVGADLIQFCSTVRILHLCQSAPPTRGAPPDAESPLSPECISPALREDKNLQAVGLDNAPPIPEFLRRLGCRIVGIQRISTSLVQASGHFAPRVGQCLTLSHHTTKYQRAPRQPFRPQPKIGLPHS